MKIFIKVQTLEGDIILNTSDIIWLENSLFEKNSFKLFFCREDNSLYTIVLKDQEEYNRLIEVLSSNFIIWKLHNFFINPDYLLSMIQSSNWEFYNIENKFSKFDCTVKKEEYEDFIKNVKIKVI